MTNFDNHFFSMQGMEHSVSLLTTIISKKLKLRNFEKLWSGNCFNPQILQILLCRWIGIPITNTPPIQVRENRTTKSTSGTEITIYKEQPITCRVCTELVKFLLYHIACIALHKFCKSTAIWFRDTPRDWNVLPVIKDTSGESSTHVHSSLNRPTLHQPLTVQGAQFQPFHAQQHIFKLHSPSFS